MVSRKITLQMVLGVVVAVAGALTTGYNDGIELGPGWVAGAVAAIVALLGATGYYTPEGGSTVPNSAKEALLAQGWKRP